MTAEQPGVAYLVREMHPREYGDQPPARKSPAVWAFPTRAEAEAFRDRMTRGCRRRDNPFTLDRPNLTDVTSMPAHEFRRLVRSLGLEAPADGRWQAWWWASLSRLSDAGLAHLWAALDRVCLYRVEEAPVPPAPAARRRAYAVQELTWQYNDNWHDLGNDEPVKAFLDREAAELYRMELEWPRREELGNPCRHPGWFGATTSLTDEELRARLPGCEVYLAPDNFDDPTWWEQQRRTLSRAAWHRLWDLFDQVRFYEVVEVDLEG